MRRFPLGDARRHLGVVLGERTELTKNVLLRRSGRFGDEWCRGEQLPRRIAAPLHLQNSAHLSILGYVERDEDDHPSREYATEREKMRAHERKV